jgi:murein DD-endopeptidase MepM/ murein hydrolase activator NlpD
VSRGEVVGYVGSTGWSTGCHLHFTLLVDGKAVDPMNWM